MPVFVQIGLFIILQASVALIARPHPRVQSATPTGAIIGHVTINDRPAPNIRIVLQPYDSPTLDIRLPRTVTDEKGNYRLMGVPEGRFKVMPIAHPFVIDDRPDSERGGMTLGSVLGTIGLIVSVAKGETINGLDFTLSPGGVITGRVVDDQGQPVIEGSVFCHPLGKQGSLNSSNPWRTDDRGIYRIYGLPAGSYLVSVMASGGGRKRYLRTFHPAMTDQARAATVKVAAGEEVTNVDIQLGQPEKSRHLSGLVVDGIGGQALSGVAIRFNGMRSSGESYQGHLLSDSQGRFEIENCPPGRYSITATSNRSSREGFYGDPTVVEVTDGDVSGVEIKAFRGGSISGVLVIENTDDSSVLSRRSHLELVASWPSPQDGTLKTIGFQSDYRVWAQVGADGRFEFNGLRPPKANLAPSNFPEGYHILRVERDGAVIQGEIAISPGERLTGIRIVVGYGTGSISGQTKIEGGTLPNKRMWVIKVLRADGQEVFFHLIDAKGQFWVKGLMAGEYEVIAEADYVEIPGVTPSPYPPPIKAKVMVANGKETEVTLILNLNQKDRK